jgi:SIR2-like domain/MalT-like TPR region
MDRGSLDYFDRAPQRNSGDPPAPDRLPDAARLWPFGAAMARRSLDPGLIEQHASQIVCRALTTGRLAVFAGAGVTMAYGRMTWGQLLEQFYGTLSDPDNTGPRHDFWQTLERWLWKGGAVEFHRDKYDYTITAQLFDEFWPERDKSLRESAATALATHAARLMQVQKHVAGSVTVKDERDITNGGIRAIARRVDAFANQERAAISGYLELIKPAEAGPEPSDEEKLERAKTLLKTYRSTFAGFGPDDGSPLSLLVNALGVRRFITTNYDEEIEHAFEAFDYPVNRVDSRGRADPAHYGTMHSTASLTRDSTASAICFAVDGPRRHASVLHLHGVAKQPSSLVVTEADYQRLYLDKHPTHDLIQNAISAAFAANPLLFVGSNVEEDDILRPLRQFVTGAAHQRDRMAVALLPAIGPDAKMAHAKLELYLRYAVHAIHYGFDYSQGAAQPWLSIAVGELDRIEALAMAISEGKNEDKDRAKVAPATLTPPKRPEGVQADDALASALHKGVVTAIDAARLLSEKPGVERARHLRIYVQELRTALISFFFCARLARIRCDLKDYQERQRWLPTPVTRSFKELDEKEEPETPSRCRLIYHRHHVALPKTGSGGEAYVPDSLNEFVEFIGKLPAFVAHPGRRTIVVSSKRGSGKGTLFDCLGDREPVKRLAEALGGYRFDGEPTPLFLHFNLSFSDEVSILAAQVATLILHVYEEGKDESQGSDLLENLANALDGLTAERRKHSNARRRCLLMLGNAGVLFNQQGRPKSGHVARMLSLLSANRYRKMPMDLIMFCEEQQVPAAFRTDPAKPRAAAARPESGGERLRRPLMRRLRRLNIPGNSSVSEIIFPLAPAKPFEVWNAVSDEPRHWPLNTDTAALDASLEPVIHNRMVSTLAVAFALTDPDSRDAKLAVQALARLTRSLRSGARDAMPERAVEAVLDGWFQRHLEGKEVDRLGHTAYRVPNGDERVDGTWKRLSVVSWRVMSEVLWHLSVISHPVELDVLLGCNAIRNALVELLQTESSTPPDSPEPTADLLKLRLGAMLHRMHEWCMVYRIGRRLRPDVSNLPRPGERYAVHRQVQKHLLRQAGGRNVETASWDQFTTTLYASQPDEAPVFTRATHSKLVRLVKSLSSYPCPDLLFDEAERSGAEPDEVGLQTRIERLRAAYFLLRSTFSLGVIARSTDISSIGSSRQGALEEYWLLVRWITIEAGRIEQLETDEPKRAFFAGEIVWLFNECAVIRLAQGKLEEAEHLLNLAETATRQIEPDDSGSMHVRVRLHTALTLIERGHAHRARAVLQPISERATGHEVPRLLARFYLGLIEHVGGNYAAAMAHYEDAEAGLRKVGRSRALAFVRQHQADLHLVLNPNDLVGAERIAREAIALAQQGGHEDLRVIASLNLARLRVEAGSQDTNGVFATLRFAEQYADRMEMPRIACEVFEIRARLLLNQGETHMSAAQASESLEISALYDLKLMKVRALLTLAQIYHARGDPAGTRKLVEFGRELATSADYYACVRAFHDLELALGEAPKAD